MAENKITIHQAFYGEVNRAHSCIKQTISDPELTSFLITFTDRPAALPPGVNLLPYLSGSTIGHYYILTKTFPDSTATRAGMVFTHVLIFKQAEIILINNLQSILSLFVESTDNKKDELNQFEIEILNTNLSVTTKQQPKYIQEVIAAFIDGTKPILFSGEIQSFSYALQQIWNSPNVLSRKTLKFRASFTPADIENVNDLTIVLIQKDFLQKWQGRIIIHGGSQEIVEITSHSEALFFGHKEGNPFHRFLIELNVDLAQVQSYGQYEKIFNHYVSIGNVEDANILRQDIRVLSKISPSPTDGVRVKQKFIQRLSTLHQTKKDTNLKALRNIDWSAFENGDNNGRQIVSLFIENELENPNQKQLEHMAELIDLSVAEEDKNWWHTIISETVEASFQKHDESLLKNIWQLIDSSEKTLKNLMSIIGSVKDCEIILRNSIPEKLRIETCKILAPFAQKKNWFLFHADIILRHFSIESSLEKQLEVEERLPLAHSIGVKYLVDKLTPVKLLELTLKSGNKKLIEFSAEAINQNISLLKDIDLTFSCWLDIWTAVVLKTRKIFSGLAGKEQAIVFSVLDLIVEGKTVDNILLGLIADTTFADISDYRDRSKVWRGVNQLHKEKFLTTTTQSVLKNLLSGKIVAESIESEISDRITSDAFLTKFLNEYRNDIRPILTIYSSFHHLKDNFLADYINYYSGTINIVEATQLGNLLQNKGFTNSAYAVSVRASKSNNWRFALANCHHLLSFTRRGWLYLSGIFSQVQLTEDQWWESLEDLITEFYPNAASLTTVWKKSGGKESELIMNATPNNVWSDALYKLRRNQFKDININDLMKEINKQYGDNQKFKIIYDLRNKFIDNKQML